MACLGAQVVELLDRNWLRLFNGCRQRAHCLFRGIRYAYLWGNNLGEELKKPEFVAGLKMLADAGLSLDTANPVTKMLAEIVKNEDLSRYIL